MKRHITHIAHSIGFLSRLPVPDRFFDNEHSELSETAGYFAIAGALISIPAAAIASVLSVFDVNSMLIAAIVLTIQTIVTGALHEDGLSDSADGLWGGKNKDKILEIMRDSRLGTYGTLTLILTFLLKFTALSHLLDSIDPLSIAIVIIVIGGISRAAMLWHWKKLPPARDNGLAHGAGEPSNDAMNIIFASAFVFMLCLFIAPFGIVIILAATLFTGFLCHFFTRLVKEKIDGHTGDTIGATQQLAEIALIVTLAISP